MASGLQRLQSLAANRVAGHQPQRDRRIGCLPLARQRRHRVRRQQRLAAACGNAQADAGHVAKRVRVVSATHQLPKRQRRAFKLGGAGESSQRVQRGLLVGLEGEGGHWVKYLDSIGIDWVNF